MPITVDVEGQNDVEADCAAIQEAISMGADVIRLHGTFDFGEQEDDRKTLTIWRSVSIEGVDDVWSPPFAQGPEFDDSNQPFPKRHAIIDGGGAWSQDLRSHTGAFLVALGVNVGSVVIRNVYFRNFRFAAIEAVRCQGLEVVDCDFRDPVPGWSEAFRNMVGTPLHSTSGVLAYSEECEGPFHVIDNECDFLDTAQEVPQDEQFVACLSTNFRTIRIIDNTITTRDDALEVLFNGNNGQSPCELLIQDNIITIEQRVGPGDYSVWPLHVGIMCCRNGTGTTTQIVHNEITASGENMSAFAFSGDHFVVRDNTVALSTGNPFFPTAAFWFGTDFSAPALGANLGASLNDSDLFQNEISGSAAYAILTYDDPATAESNDSHGSVVEENDFSGFTASLETVSPAFWERNTDIDNLWP